MSAYENWVRQKDTLRETLQSEEDISRSLYQVRHAIAQAEQCTLAELSDDVLRQQGGVLFASLKSSLAFAECVREGKIWHEMPTASKRLPIKWYQLTLWGLLVLVLVCALIRGMRVICVLTLLAAVFSVLPVLIAAKPADRSEGAVKVSLRLDVRELMIRLDGSMRNIDRYLTDFDYLNHSLQSGSTTADTRAAQHVSGLLSTLFDIRNEGGDVQEALDHTRCLLERIGMEFREYSADNARYFSVLPSKSENCTITPAVFAIDDGHLLMRGTAVRTNASESSGESV